MSTSPPPVPPAVDITSLRPPSSGTPLWVTVTVALTCLGLGLGVSFMLNAGRPAVVEPKPVPSASASASSKPPPTLLQRAAAGEAAAMDKLAAVDAQERSAEQMIALAQGRSVQKHLALEHLRGELKKTVDEDLLKKLMGFARDGETAKAAVEVMSELPGKDGPDMLYDIATSKGTATDTAQLAAQLIGTKAVRSKASPALSLVLDLREATTCEERQKLLEKAVEVGDRRALRQVIALTKKRGCGDNKRDDCNPCLREDNSKLLRQAIKSTQRRKAPDY